MENNKDFKKSCILLLIPLILFFILCIIGISINKKQNEPRLDEPRLEDYRFGICEIIDRTRYDKGWNYTIKIGNDNDTAIIYSEELFSIGELTVIAEYDNKSILIDID